MSDSPGSTRGAVMARGGMDIGVTCTAAAVVLVLVSNLLDIGRFHTSLLATQAQQTAGLATTGRAEAQLEALAKGTQALADAGNPNATSVLAVLRQNGVQIKPGAAGAGTAPGP